MRGRLGSERQGQNLAVWHIREAYLREGVASERGRGTVWSVFNTSVENGVCEGFSVGPQFQVKAVGARTLNIASKFSAMLCTLLFPVGGVFSESSDDPPCCDLGEGTVVSEREGDG